MMRSHFFWKGKKVEDGPLKRLIVDYIIINRQHPELQPTIQESMVKSTTGLMRH